MQAHDALAEAGSPAAEEAPLITLAERLGRTAAVARALILAGRTVDLAGIEDGIGLLCAKTLDLPRDQARHMLPCLHEVLEQITLLTAALHQPEPD